MENLVCLTCVKEKGKLRVKILSKGYLPNANCQFPRDLRVEGKNFYVNREYLKLAITRGKYFYSCLKRKEIHELPTLENNEMKELIEITRAFENLKIYQDETTDECVVCMDGKKDTVFCPCGHYYCCSKCATKLTICPICRSPIDDRIDKSKIQ